MAAWARARRKKPGGPMGEKERERGSGPRLGWKEELSLRGKMTISQL